MGNCKQATAACDSGSGIVRLELLLNQMELYSWKTLPTGELNHAQSIRRSLNADMTFRVKPEPLVFTIFFLGLIS